MSDVILASNSPRRKELLALFDFPFTVVPADVDEHRRLGEPPVDYVRRLAREKAQAVAAIRKGLILAADTIVVDGDELLGKPIDDDDARRMLRQLRGRVHQVYTGIALIDTLTDQDFSDVCQTDVSMRTYAEAEMEAYIATGDPRDKAGAYAIQHPEFHPVNRLSGCYASVMGLPLCCLVKGFRHFGLEAPLDLPARCQALLDYECPDLKAVMGIA